MSTLGTVAVTLLAANTARRVGKAVLLGWARADRARWAYLISETRKRLRSQEDAYHDTYGEPAPYNAPNPFTSAAEPPQPSPMASAFASLGKPKTAK